MTTVKLIAKDGKLYIPNVAVYDRGALFDPTDDPIVMAHYGEDCDTLPWPLVEGPYWTMTKIKDALQLALMDDRETGVLSPQLGEVVLPDGQVFVIDTGEFRHG